MPSSWHNGVPLVTERQPWHKILPWYRNGRFGINFCLNTQRQKLLFYAKVCTTGSTNTLCIMHYAGICQCTDSPMHYAAGIRQCRDARIHQCIIHYAEINYCRDSPMHGLTNALYTMQRFTIGGIHQCTMHEYIMHSQLVNPCIVHNAQCIGESVHSIGESPP